MSALAETVPVIELGARGFAGALAVEAPMGNMRFLPSPSAARRIEPGTVLLWIGTPLDEPSVRARAADLLDDATTTAIARLQDTRDRAASFIAHASLRIALSAAMDCTPRDIRLERTVLGKPHLSDRDGLHFSLSHTRGAVGFALALRPVGFDLEEARSLPDMDGLAEIAFAEEMQTALRAAPADKKTALFFRYWTLGEAYIKATGLGVSQGLQSFAFAADDPPRLLRATPGWGPPNRWRFAAL